MYITDNEVTSERISSFLSEVNAPKPKEVRILNEKSGFIIYSEVEEALEAAALVNNGSIQDGNVIRLNFKKTIPASENSFSANSNDFKGEKVKNENENSEGNSGSVYENESGEHNNNSASNDVENDVFVDGMKEDEDVVEEHEEGEDVGVMEEEEEEEEEGELVDDGKNENDVFTDNTKNEDEDNDVDVV